MLDLRVILSRRVDLGLSRRKLRVHSGWSAPRWAGLEAGTNHGLVTLDELQRMADALAIAPEQLLARRPKPEPQPLDVTIEAMLFGAGKRVPIGVLADACETSPRDVSVALERLRDRLQHSGTTVVLTSTGAELVPAAGVVTDDQLARLARETLPETGMELHAARLLRRILAGEFGPVISDTNESERRWLAYLRRLGYLRATNRGLEVAPDVAESLGQNVRPLRRLRRRDPDG